MNRFSICCAFLLLLNMGFSARADIEGDVYPPSLPGISGGNGLVQFHDWLQTLTVATGLGMPLNARDLTVLDTAPRAALGNGRLTISDVVQTYRYSYGGDNLAEEGGPASPVDVPPVAGNGARKLVLEAGDLSHGRIGKVRVIFNRAGDEQGAAFTLSFRTNQLKLKKVEYPTGPYTVTNTFRSAEGLLGVGILLSPVQEIGRTLLVEITFEVLASASPTTEIQFVNTVATCEVASVNADPLITTFENGTFPLTGTAPSVTVVGEQEEALHMVLNGDLNATYTIQSSADLVEWISIKTLTNTGNTPFYDPFSTPRTRRFYRAIPAREE